MVIEASNLHALKDSLESCLDRFTQGGSIRVEKY